MYIGFAEKWLTNSAEHLRRGNMRKWFKKVGIKTIKTMAETAISIIGTNAVGITDVDWLGVLSAVALSGVVTVLFNIKELPESGGK